MLGVVLALLLMVIAVILVSNIVTIRRIDGGEAWLKVGRAFLDSF